MSIPMRIIALASIGMAHVSLAACGSDDASESAESLTPGDASADARDSATTDGHASAADARATEASHADAASDVRSPGDSAFPEVSTSPVEAGVACLAFDAGAPPDGGGFCGDGFRNPSTEECDDGLRDASVRRGCSAACQVEDELAVAQIGGDGGLANAPRTIGAGRHPIATSNSTFAVTYLETESQPPALSLAVFSSNAVPNYVLAHVNAGSTVLQDTNPVVAGLPCDAYAVAWTDYGGDGDELGAAVALVQGGAIVNGPIFANATTIGSQFDPDLVWTGSELVAAWVDDSDVTTGPDIRFRTFDATSLAASSEQILAATDDAEADVALTTFAGSWAAAWRDDASGLETIRVHSGATDWTVGPAFLPSPVTSKPALVELDATHLLVAYAVGLAAAGADGGASDAGGSDGGSLDAGIRDAGLHDAGDAAAVDGGNANGTASAPSSKIQVAILSTASPGAVTGVDITASVSSALRLSQAQPNVVNVNGSLFLAWWTAAALGDPNGEETWLKALAWNGTTLATTQAEVPLPRWPQARVGNQRSPAMAVNASAPGGALVIGWDDLGNAIAAGEGNGDVVVEMAPVPLLRTAGDGGP